MAHVTSPAAILALAAGLAGAGLATGAAVQPMPPFTPRVGTGGV